MKKLIIMLVIALTFNTISAQDDFLNNKVGKELAETLLKDLKVDQPRVYWTLQSYAIKLVGVHNIIGDSDYRINDRYQFMLYQAVGYKAVNYYYDKSEDDKLLRGLHDSVTSDVPMFDLGDDYKDIYYTETTRVYQKVPDFWNCAKALAKWEEKVDKANLKELSNIWQDEGTRKAKAFLEQQANKRKTKNQI